LAAKIIEPTSAGVRLDAAASTSSVQPSGDRMGLCNRMTVNVS
jgi:hypothetical protein